MNHKNVAISLLINRKESSDYRYQPDVHGQLRSSASMGDGTQSDIHLQNKEFKRFADIYDMYP